MTEETRLVPIEERRVPFYEDDVIAYLVFHEHEYRIYVPLRPLCRNLGIQWSAQRKRLYRDPILAKGVVMMDTPSAGGDQQTLALRLELLPGWLFGIETSRMDDEARKEKVDRYREECFRVLWQEFQSRIAPPSPAAEQGMSLAQIADFGRAITQMAEQHLALQEQLGETHDLAAHAHARLDKAAEVIRALQRRTTTLEGKLHPQAYITDEQAAHVSQLVKALANLLTERGGKNQYQGIFAELYRRFGVSGYKLIRIEQYDAVLAFLEQWREAAMRGAE